jgi:hypothetical protein
MPMHIRPEGLVTFCGTACNNAELWLSKQMGCTTADYDNR